MSHRLAIVLLVCGGLGYFLQREQGRGTYDDWERALVGWLERGMARRDDPPPVVLVELKRGDLPFESWPPAPLDYALVLENLVRRQPREVVVQPVLSWGSMELLDAATLAERIALLPRGVLACTLQTWGREADDHDPFAGGAIDDPAAEPGAADAPGAAAPSSPDLPWPVLPGASGDLDRVASFGSLGLAPDDAVRGGKSMGFTRIDAGGGVAVDGASVAVPLVARRGGDLVPSLVLQALMNWQSADAGEVVVQLGRRVMVGPSMSVPLDRAGRQVLLPRLAAPVRRIDAGVLLLDLERDHQLMAERAAELGVLESMEGALVVLGEAGDGVPRFPVAGSEDGGWTEAEVVARALVAAMAGWHPWEIPIRWQWVVWSVVVALGAVLLRCPRKWWPVFALGGFAAIALTITLAFLLRQWWLPPVSPLALWSAAAVVALLLPNPPPVGAPVSPLADERASAAAGQPPIAGKDDHEIEGAEPTEVGAAATPVATPDQADNAQAAVAGGPNDQADQRADPEADEAAALASQLADDPESEVRRDHRPGDIPTGEHETHGK